MSYNSNRRPPQQESAGGQQPPKRRLKTKPLMILILLLLLGNLLWFIAWLIPNGGEKAAGGNGQAEVVAEVGKETIDREQWMAAMEERYGRETLLTLVNELVMETAADEYDIEVTDEEIDLELAMLRSTQDTAGIGLYAEDEARLRERTKSQLILEKVLTKDVVIEEEQVKAFYEENRSIYEVADSYRTHMIVVGSQQEAEEAISELENGSSFDVLARERSLDRATGSLGGDIGFITADQSSVDPAIAAAVESIESGKWSGPLPLQDGRVAVITVTEKTEGQTFTFEEVASHIGRELALEQLPQSVSPEAFWQEFEAKWFYGEGSE